MPIPKGYVFTPGTKAPISYIVRKKLMTPAQFWKYIASLMP